MTSATMTTLMEKFGEKIANGMPIDEVEAFIGSIVSEYNTLSKKRC